MTTTAQDTNKSLFAALKSPFFSKDIEWRLGNTNKDKTRGRALPYLKFMAVADRLDDVLGEENWKDEYVAGPAGGVVCRLSVRVAGEWICKENGAGNTDMEGIKGGLTDAFKRAATMWGVGRYLHAYDAIVVDVDPQTNRFQPPALPDALLPAEEVEESRLAYEAAALLTAEAEKATAAAAGDTATPAIARVAKPAKAAAVKDIPVADDAVAQPAAEDGTATGVAEHSVPGVADPVLEVAAAEVADVAPAAEVLDLTDAVKVADVVEVVEVAEVGTAAEVAEFVDFKEVPAVAEVVEVAAAVEPAAAPIVAAVVEAIPAADGAAEPVVEAAAPAGDVLIVRDAYGMPVMPEDLPEPQVKRIAQLVERIDKNVPLHVIRDYVESGKGHDSMTPVSRAYVLARLDHKKKQQESAANAA